MKRRKSKWTLVLICFLMLLNAVLAIAVRIYDRNQIVKAISDQEGTKTLLVTQKETKIL